MATSASISGQGVSGPLTDFGRITRVTLLSAAVSAGFSLTEYLLYLHTGSLALKADAFHTGSDVLAAGLVLANSMVLRDRSRWIERLSGLIIAALMFAAASNVIIESWQPKDTEPRHLGLAIAAVIAVVVTTYSLARYKIKAGREENFRLLSSEGRHTYMDALSSVVVLIGLIGQQIGVRLDTPAAMVVAALIAATAWSVARDHIMDAAWMNGQWRRRPSFPRFGFAALVLAGIYLLSGVYIVDPGETALVQRWGRLVRTAGPGLHFRLPSPLEKLTILESGRINRIDIGFRNTAPAGPDFAPDPASTPPDPPTAIEERQTDGIKTPDKVKTNVDPTDEFIYGTEPGSQPGWNPAMSLEKASPATQPAREAIRFTGDQNLIEVKISVFYRIVDPVAYMFRVENKQDLLKALCESAVMMTLSQNPLDAVMGADRDRLLAEMKNKVNLDAQVMNLGVKCLWFSLLDLRPPRQVLPAFHMAASAHEDRERYINEAETRARMIANQGLAQQWKLRAEARAYEAAAVLGAEAEADRLTALQKSGDRRMDVFKDIMYLEMMEEMLKGRPKLFLAPDKAPIYLDLRRDRNKDFIP